MGGEQRLRLLKGSRMPRDNDSATLLDVHRRAVPGVDRMARYADGE
jgi:hypothetical protein